MVATWRLVTLASILLLWQLASMADYAGPALVPGLQDLLPTIVVLPTRPDFWPILGNTVGIALISLVIGGVLGTSVGFVIGRMRTVYRSTRLLLEFLRAAPTIGLMPIFILMMGTGPTFMIALVSLGCVWPFLVQTSQGASRVEPGLMDIGRSYRIPGPLVIWKVVLPSTLPYIATALRLALVMSILMTIGIQSLVMVSGVGSQITLSALDGAITEMWAWVVIAALLGVLFTAVAEWSESRIIYWRPSERKRS